MKDYYYILGVENDATLEEIKKAYRKLSLKFHPDKNDSDIFFENRFKDIQEAYDNLKDPYLRSIYDERYAQFYSTFNKKKGSTKESNIQNPKIIDFSSDLIELELGGLISLNWKTINADKVTLSCSKGFQQLNGSKRIRIKTFKQNDRTSITLTAINSVNNAIDTKTIIFTRKSIPEQVNNIPQVSSKTGGYKFLRSTLLISFLCLMLFIIYKVGNGSGILRSNIESNGLDSDTSHSDLLISEGIDFENLTSSAKLFHSLFEVIEITSDTSAICYIPATDLKDSYGSSLTDPKIVSSISYHSMKTIKFRGIDYIFLFFHTLRSEKENGIWVSYECRWCKGHLTIARFIKAKDGSYSIDELIYDCLCGRRSTFGGIEIPKLTNLNNEFLIMDAEDYYWNEPTSISFANICDGLNLNNSTFYLQEYIDESGENEPDFDLAKIEYVLHNSRPTIKTNGGKENVFDLGYLFGLKENMNMFINEWYEDDPLYEKKDDPMMKIFNLPHVLLQSYYDNFKSKTLVRENLQKYNELLLVYHDEILLTNNEAI